MFDHYLQMSSHVREVAFSHPQTQTTWQDAVRENRDTDAVPSRAHPAPKRLVYALTTGLVTRLRRRPAQLRHQPAA
jgi:hypothetical protein